MAAALALAAGAAGAVYAATHRDAQTGRHNGTGASPTGGTTLSASAAPVGYAACTVAGVSAYCPVHPLCWGTITPVSGAVATAPRIDCGALHSWESFAAGYLPAGAVNLPPDKLLTDPTIKRICGDVVLAARSTSPGDTQGWSVRVLPETPTSSPAVFHCLAAPPSGGRWRGSAFITG